MVRYIIRNGEIRDLDRIQDLAGMLNTVNLPNDPKVLEKVLEKSSQSFNGEIENFNAREYLFVLEDRLVNRIIGTSQIIGQHGTRDMPHIFFEVSQMERYSGSLDRHFKHQVLRLGFNFDGPTEIGGLIVDPDYRHVPEKLGRQLSMVRFVFIAMNRALFQKRVLAELLPPMSCEGESIMWESLGKKFTGLKYHQADHYSRTNKEFIINLFPSGDIYTCLFNEEVQEVIGSVGAASVPAKKMLESIGFTYQNRIDPFDGGPHFEADTDKIEPILKSRVLKMASGPNRRSNLRPCLVASLRDGFSPGSSFRAAVVYGEIDEENGLFKCEALVHEALLTKDGSEVTVYQMP